MSDRAEVEAILGRIDGGWTASHYASTLANAVEEIIGELAAEYRRGQEWAIEALRDGERFTQWAFKTSPAIALVSDVCADYLTSIAQKESTDG